MRKMSATIKQLVEQANTTMQNGTLAENNKLFMFITNVLIKNNMYHGYNTYCRVNDELGPRLKLIGSCEDRKVNKVREQETDIRQFYIV